MADFLDQAEIDRLQYELVAIGAKKEKAHNCVDKIKEMFYDTVKMPLFSNLDSLEEIGECINKLESYIKRESKYYASFLLLKSRYLKRL